MAMCGSCDTQPSSQGPRAVPGPAAGPPHPREETPAPRVLSGHTVAGTHLWLALLC